MEQLTGMDASFLHTEMGNAPMHIGPLFIYDVSTAPNGFVRFKDILETFEKRLHLSTVFRRKLLNVPLNLDQPYWIEDDSFDLEFHVRHIALPKPGDWRQLCIQVARLHARPLDRSRPLWEAYVIEGLDNVEGVPKGGFALFLKIHHAAIDGATGTEIMGAIHDLSANAEPVSADEHWRPEHPPSTPKLLWSAYLENLRHPLRIAKVLGKGVPAWRRLRTAEKENKFHSLGKKERTRFNGPVSSHRVFGAANFDLGEVRKIKSAVEGATVNDAILTIVAGALRNYLSAKGELPEKSLVTGAPVNVRSEEEAGSGGNVVSMMSIALRTDIADPMERLGAVHQAAVQSKAYHNAMGARMMSDISNSLPSHITALGFRAASAAGLMADSRPIFNTIVTNVPGPQVPLYMGGARLVRSLGTGPCMDNMGLFHPVTSYDGMIAISFQACREMMPDPQFYEECLYQSFTELRSAALGGAGKEKKAAARAGKTGTKRRSAKVKA